MTNVDDGDEHVYLSTSCLHGKHEYCQSDTGVNESGEKWDKKANRCKWCTSSCVCGCHAEK